MHPTPSALHLLLPSTLALLLLNPPLTGQQEQLASGPLSTTPGFPHDISISPDGTRAAVHSDGTAAQLVLIDLTTGFPVRSLASPGRTTASLTIPYTFVPPGTLDLKIVSSVVLTADRVIAIGNELAVSPDVGFNGGSVFIYDADTGTLLNNMAVETTKDLAVTPDGQTAVVVTDDGPTRFFSLATGQQVGMGLGSGTQYGTANPGPAQSVRTTNDFAVVIGKNSVPPEFLVRIFDMRTSPPTLAFTWTGPAFADSLGAYDLDLSPDESTAAVHLDGGETQLFSLDPVNGPSLTASVTGSGRTFLFWDAEDPWYWFPPDTIRVSNKSVITIGGRIQQGVRRSTIIAHQLDDPTVTHMVDEVGLPHDLEIALDDTLAIVHSELNGYVFSLNPVGTDLPLPITPANPGAVGPGFAFGPSVTSEMIQNSVVATDAGYAAILGQGYTPLGQTAQPARVSLFDLTGPTPILMQRYDLSNPAERSLHDIAVSPNGKVAAIPNEVLPAGEPIGSILREARFFNMLDGAALATLTTPGDQDGRVAQSVVLTDEHGVTVGGDPALIPQYAVYDLCQDPTAMTNPDPSTLSVVGTSSISDNDLSLRIDAIPTGSLGTLFVSDQALAPQPPTGFGGTLFLSNAVNYLTLAAPRNQDFIVFPTDLTAAPFSGYNISPGTALSFQVLYRDTSAPGGAQYSSALSVTLCP